ncbi:hypothetical protein QWY82_08010 [Simiduia curdlanivorans]|uniref:Uncharacterized protein n=1 Tax=Simiduia curdlanivorans TaxID=1492769 RepID=A0ABV8V8B2_9GAMM|nr:hypothetical protein [Simiduia curdlanivorans]MDN3638748.1 hypothetical protein [Simiduia curdlanivorans]
MFRKIINLFRRRPNQQSTATIVHDSPAQDLSYDDHQWAAVEARKTGERHMKEGDYNAAWKHLCIAKDEFIKHASDCGFTFDQSIALDATISEIMADVLRREGRHIPALVHIIYWIIAGSRVNKKIKRHGDKFKAYFDRCKFTSISRAEAWLEVQFVGDAHAYFIAESLVKRWSGFGEEN